MARVPLLCFLFTLVLVTEGTQTRKTCKQMHDNISQLAKVLQAVDRLFVYPSCLCTCNSSCTFSHASTCLPQKSLTQGWHHLWSAAMVMSDTPVPEDSTVCFTCCPFCCHAATTPTAPEEGVHCITSFVNKKHSVVWAAQMACEAFSRLFGAVRTGLWTKRPVS